jgi:hypothetical protein
LGEKQRAGSVYVKNFIFEGKIKIYAIGMSKYLQGVKVMTKKKWKIFPSLLVLMSYLFAANFTRLAVALASSDTAATTNAPTAAGPGTASADRSKNGGKHPHHHHKDEGSAHTGKSAAPAHVKHESGYQHDYHRDHENPSNSKSK